MLASGRCQRGRVHLPLASIRVEVRLMTVHLLWERVEDTKNDSSFYLE